MAIVRMLCCCCRCWATQPILHIGACSVLCSPLLFPVCLVYASVCLFGTIWKRASTPNETTHQEKRASARMGFIIVIIISMLLFDLCECVLWKSIHTLVFCALFLGPRTVVGAVAAIASKMHELSLCSFVYYMGISIHLVMNDEMLLIWIAYRKHRNNEQTATEKTEKTEKTEDRGIFANNNSSTICDKCYEV